MSLDPLKASRFGSCKVRTGCLTCVRRRIKCGEEKPACLHCTKSGRVCQQRNQTRSSDDLRIIQYTPAPPTILSGLPRKNGVEVRSLEYFRIRTAPELAGVHEPGLWTEHVMRIAAATPAIWHAIVALGSLHEHFENSIAMTLRDVDLTIPLTQYGKAINHLHGSLRDPSNQASDLPLVACALFCAFESMSYHLDSALSQVASGLKVLGTRVLVTTRPRATSPSPDLLSPLFTRLDTQRLEFGYASFTDQLPSMSLPHVEYSVLHDMNDARLKIDRVLNSLIHQIRWLKQYEGRKDCRLDNNQSEPCATCGDPVRDYLHWASAFDSLLQIHRPQDRDLPSALVLQIWRIFINIKLRVDVSDGEMGYDAFLDDFAAMVDMAEEFLCWSAKHGTESGELFRRSVPSLTHETLSEELRHQHRGIVDNAPRWCGFTGIELHSPSQLASVKLESATARNMVTRLLVASRTARMRIFEHAARISASDRPFKPAYTYSHGVVYLLYVTVSRCRDPAIRRRALRMLHLCNRREGLWDSALAARLGQRLIQIEENHAIAKLGKDLGLTPAIETASQIPHDCRIRIIDTTFLPDKRSAERYYFDGSDGIEPAVGAQQVWVEGLMEW